MDVDVNKLKQSITELTGGTKAAKLRRVMPEIEEKLDQGVRHEEIVAALHAGGLDVTLETFRKTLYRYRAQRAGGTKETPPKAVRATTADGNSLARTYAPQEDLTADEAADETPTSTSFDDALDRRKRDQVGESYLTRRKPIIGKKRTT
ncbi:hypothetical protein LN565_14935 [Xanthomonas euvesicatoria pv. euvesicatoria]|uniref:Stable plasmid inheritance protein n=3 Tax=Xanthomonas TaxID=338 RepID=A0A6P0E6D3_XANPE|nr:MULTISPECIES: hypothetical protein [Xanthomonas]KHL55230.1 membrane protein [Xanthomonas euvesicatoria]KLA50438.1 membrane protein [Xanthomonas euvesicatoria]KLA53030.1 membrane protein [Xanthomonas euvesicatoria]KLA54797.1 membrane protein [Xanthomonas euvesicatoria]KLA63981.1 membrane protein [Xanthomonas euvesicatoria]